MKFNANKILVIFTIAVTMALTIYIVVEFAYPKKTIVFIEALPKEDVIFLDDIQQSSPVLELKQGTYKLRIEKSLHETWQQTLNIKSTKKEHVQIYLKPNTAKVIFTSEPAGAEVFIDEEYNGITPLIKDLSIKKHPYKLLIKNDGYKNHIGMFKIENLYHKKMAIKLELLISDDNINEYMNDFMFIKGGTFQMGDLFTEGEKDEYPIRTVSLNGFWLGQFEITQFQWKIIMGSNPSKYKNDSYPVENVSWNDIQKFIEKLNSKSSRSYRLPTEAEWEYACREGGKKVRFGNGTNELKYGEINTISNANKSAPVGRYSPNALGLYDMSGNVNELVQDRYKDSYHGLATNNPKGPSKGSHRVSRGGSWYNDGGYNLRCSSRFSYDPSIGDSETGFRLIWIK